MQLPALIQRYLDQSGMPYQLLGCPHVESLAQAAEKLGLPTQRLVRSVLLQGHEQLVMAILPYNHILDFSLLLETLFIDFEPLYGLQTDQFFTRHGCNNHSRPPLPAAFALSAIADYSLVVDQDEQLYFDSGNGSVLVGMRSSDFCQMQAAARWANFAVSTQHLDAQLREATATPEKLADITRRYTPTRFGEDLEAMIEFPELPSTAQWLLALRRQSDVSVQDIVQVVEQDPSLVAQVIYAARSPLHSYGSTVDSLEVAIGEVLGVENTLNLLISSCMGQAFHIPLDGPTGLQSFWRHSIYCAALVSELVKLLPDLTTIRPPIANLCGLLHNFGYLVLGHAMPARFFLYNRSLAANPNIPFATIERYVLGIEHWHVGAWLMQTWAMPEEVVATLRWHHHEDCTQPHAEYSNLVLVANRLLYHIELGEEPHGRLPTLALFTLGITRDQAFGALERVQLSMGALDSLAAALRLPLELG